MPQSPLTLPKILDRSITACSRFFKIETLQLKFSNGEQREFERLKGGGQGAVLIVPFIDQQTILLVREYAAGTHRYELGFPKGLIDPGETPIEAANRELKEEVGYGAKQLSVLKEVVIAPSYFNSKMTLFMADKLYQEKLVGDEPEPLEVIHWPLNNIEALLQRDDFQEARSISALLLAIKATKLK